MIFSPNLTYVLEKVDDKVKSKEIDIIPLILEVWTMLLRLYNFVSYQIQ